MPLEHFAVGSRGEGIAGEPGGEGGPVNGIGDVEALYCGLEEWNVLFWLEQELDSLPSYKALRCERWD